MDWMAWTWPTAIFFMVIASLLITFTVIAIKFPETPRVGILRIETTRGHLPTLRAPTRTPRPRRRGVSRGSSSSSSRVEA